MFQDQACCSFLNTKSPYHWSSNISMFPFYAGCINICQIKPYFTSLSLYWGVDTKISQSQKGYYYTRTEIVIISLMPTITKSSICCQVRVVIIHQVYLKFLILARDDSLYACHQAQVMSIEWAGNRSNNTCFILLSKDLFIGSLL
jgi:hypothetical protein